MVPKILTFGAEKNGKKSYLDRYIDLFLYKMYKHNIKNNMNTET